MTSGEGGRAVGPVRRPVESGIRVTVLGSGTLVPDDDRRSAAHLAEGPGWTVLLDCGFGVVHGLTRFGIDPRTFSHVVLSHYHTDHIGDLAPLLFGYSYAPPAPRTAPLVLLGPPGLHERLHGLARGHGDFLRDPPYPLEVLELPLEATWEDPGLGLRLRCHPTGHTAEAVAWRVEGRDGSVVGYTGDTGANMELASFLEGLDLLISECSHDDPVPWDGHLTPGGVAAMARVARPGGLLLTHLYPGLDPESLPEKVRLAGWSGPVQVARDGMVCSIG
jgi:ribonuclease BN (tRNA processing enzyme)